MKTLIVYTTLQGLGLRPQPVGLFHTYNILSLLTLILFAGLLVMTMVIVVGLLMVARTCNSVKSLPLEA